MIRIGAPKNYLLSGLFIAIIWHFFWFLLITPSLKRPDIAPFSCRTVFLGPILKERDLRIYSMVDENKTKRVIKSSKDLSRETYFNNDSKQFHKPKAPVDSKSIVSNIPQTRVVYAFALPPASEDFVFGLTDFSLYLDKVDFAELKRVSSRDDLTSFIDLRVLLGSSGIVEDVNKVAGSGDPVLDLYVMRKFKTAIFKGPYQNAGWVNVRFRIK